MANNPAKRFFLLLALLLAACAREAPDERPIFHAEGYPESLSEWKLMTVADGGLSLSPAATPYDLATPLFTDYALKLRTVTLPEGARATYRSSEAFDFPVGTIISKTFYYRTPESAWTGDVAQAQAPAIIANTLPLDGVRLVETRLLVRREAGWVAIPYVWNDEQNEARLQRTGAAINMTLHRADGRADDFAYIVPNQNQCAGCHATNNTTRALEPIGPKARHLNRTSMDGRGVNQLDDWTARGMLDGAPASAAAPRNVSWTDESETLDARARAYLDANCSHCHSDVGPADTSGLDLRPDIAFGPKYGACKASVAAGGGSGGRPYDIVPGAPGASIFTYRMETTKPGDMMPELGRSTAHEEGVALIAAWIAAMPGGCG